jgi:hypothetical protein
MNTGLWVILIAVVLVVAFSLWATREPKSRGPRPPYSGGGSVDDTPPRRPPQQS